MNQNALRPWWLHKNFSACIAICASTASRCTTRACAGATLRYLHEAGPRTIGQVQEYIYVSASATSEMLSRLEADGYVTRTRCKKDQRVVYVELTPEGRRLAEETPLGGIPLLRERIKSLSPEQLATVTSAFEMLLQVMEIEE
jgi:DNA-binding MarR family transcriptional regulator